jgi:hypothetical protein
MGAGAIEGNQGPDYDEVQQLEPEMPRVPVDVCGTVPVQIAQATDGLVTGKQLLFANTEATKLLNGDETRGVVTLVSGNSYFIGYTKNDCESQIARIPGSTPIQVRSNADIWVKAATADTYVTAIAEMWIR